MRKSTRIILPVQVGVCVVTDNHKNQLTHFLYRNASASGFVNHLCVVDSQRQESAAPYCLPLLLLCLILGACVRQVCECKLKLNSLKERKQKRSSSILQVHTHIKTHSLAFVCFLFAVSPVLSSIALIEPEKNIRMNQMLKKNRGLRHSLGWYIWITNTLNLLNFCASHLF